MMILLRLLLCVNIALISVNAEDWRRVSGGIVARPGLAPFQALLVHNNSFFCSGSIISGNSSYIDCLRN